MLASKIEREQLMKKLPELSEQILEIAREHGRVTVSDTVEVIKANRNTMKLRFKELVADGYLAPQGRGRGKGTWYTIGS